MDSPIKSNSRLQSSNVADDKHSFIASAAFRASNRKLMFQPNKKSELTYENNGPNNYGGEFQKQSE